MTEAKIDRILAVDCGSATTSAILIDKVKDRYRLAATGQSSSTYGPPWQDITVGVQEAVRQIEKATGHTLLTPGGRPMVPRTATQQGADAFVAVSSAGPPLRILLIGLMEKFSLTSARRAAARTYTYVSNVLSLDADEHRSVNQPGLESRMQVIREEQPDVIMLVGGTDGGAEKPVVEMVNMVTIALQVFNELGRPTILYAGNLENRQQVAEILGPVADLKAIDNVRPTLEVENLAAAQTELENLYIQRKMSRLPGFQTLSNWSQHPIAPSSKSFEKVIAYLGRQNGLNVLGANIGSGATTLAWHVPGHHASVIRSDAGMGYGLAPFLKTARIEKIQRWLPFELAPEALYNQLLNHSFHPTSLPANHEELMIEYAVAREMLHSVLGQARAGWPLQQVTGLRDIQWNLIVGAGLLLARAPQPTHAAMILLDGLQPWGVTNLALDTNSVATLLGSIASIQPTAAVEVAAHGVFLNLATVVAPAGHGEPDKPALNFKVTYADGRTVEAEVPYGSIEVTPLPVGERATLEMRPARRFDIGLGQPGRGALAEVEGGVLGIIIDARGRPLRLPKDDNQRYQQLEQWLASLGETHAATNNNA